MLPIQFILLLILVSLPTELYRQRVYPFTAPPTSTFLYAAASLVIAHAILALVVMARTRRTLRLLNDTSASATEISMRADAFFAKARWLTVILTGFHLFVTVLPQGTFYYLGQTRILRHIPLIPECLFLLPAVLTWLVVWTGSYFLESAAHDRGLPYRLARGAPVHEMPTLFQFLSMQVRHNFFPLLFVVFQAGVVTLGEFLTRSKWIPYADLIAPIAAVIILLAILPWILTTLWSTRPLLGPLRDRLDQVATRYRLRFRNILLWNTHNLVINAAIVGWLPRVRYFLMSDTLLESFSDRQLEAVFAHEVGHGVHRHIPWYIATIFGSLLLAFGSTALLILCFIQYPAVAQNEPAIGMVLFNFLLILIGGLSLPLIAPRFEHQADWFASRHMSEALRELPATIPANTEQKTSDATSPEAPDSPPAAQIPEDALPSEAAPAEAVTLPEYLAGNYPHAAAALDRAGGLPAELKPLPPPAAAAQLGDPGSEVFVSVLNSLIEQSHRSRSRRGFMHPSIDDRIRLLRRLSNSPRAVEQFNRLMFRTRLMILTLLAAGIAAITAAAFITEALGPTTTAPAQTSPATTQ